MEDAIDDWLLRQIHLLRREDAIAKGINWLQDVLWPEGTFFIKVGNAGSNSISEEEKRGSPSATGSNEAVSPSASFEMQREAVRRAHDIKNMIFGGAPSTLMSLIGHRRYRRSAEDVYYFLQSTTCMRQLTYSVLELLLVTVFPELKDLILDIHNKAAY